MSLNDRLLVELQRAMKEHDDLRRDVLRLARAAVHNAEIERKRPLSDEEVIGILQREAKQRRESIEEFGKGGRLDLVEKEERELAILLGYLPRQLPADEIRAVVEAVVIETGAAGPSDLGKVMPLVMERWRGRADGRLVNQIAREVLARTPPTTEERPE